MFDAQNGTPRDQVQRWIAENPQFAQAVAASMAPQPANVYQPMSMNNPNWNSGGRNMFPTTQTTTPIQTPVTAAPSLHGRIISNPNDIRPNEISMDGSASLFPMADDSCIYAKAWGSDGTIQTIRYVPEKPVEAVQDQGPSEFDQVMTRLDKIEQMLGQRFQNQKQYYQKNNRRDQNEIRTVDGNSPKEVNNV